MNILFDTAHYLKLSDVHDDPDFGFTAAFRKRRANFRNFEHIRISYTVTNVTSIRRMPGYLNRGIIIQLPLIKRRTHTLDMHVCESIGTVYTWQAQGETFIAEFTPT
jgi:hypothetical protein